MSNERSPSSHAAAGISVELIVAATLAEIAEVGVSGLTMRSVADRLKIRTPSLYHHIRNKDELLAIVAGSTFTSDSINGYVVAFEQLTTLNEWINLVVAGTQQLRQFYSAHPGLAGLMQATAHRNRVDRTGSRGDLIRVQIEALVRLGLSGHVARDMFLTLAQWNLAAVVADSATASSSPDADVQFERGLTWLMNGFSSEVNRIIHSTSVQAST